MSIAPGTARPTLRLTELDGSYWVPADDHADQHRAFLDRQLVARTHEVHGLLFACAAGVYQPDDYSSTRFMLRELCSSSARYGRRVLDVGTGCGAIGVVLASMGKDVTALDIDPVAVACARANAERNQVALRVLQSDLFAALGEDGERFDLVVFNPPLLSSPVAHPIEHIACDPDGGLRHRFLKDAPGHLAPGGGVAFLAANIGHRGALFEDLEAYDHHVAATEYHLSSGGVFRWLVVARPKAQALTG